MKRGEAVRVLVEYDLFGNQVSGSRGIFLKEDDKTGKCLLYFPDVGEWAEINKVDLERVSPGRVSKEDKEFVSRVKTLEYTYGTDP